MALLAHWHVPGTHELGSPGLDEPEVVLPGGWQAPRVGTGLGRAGNGGAGVPNGPHSRRVRTAVLAEQG
jgi:hypothetical protein